MNNFQIIFPVGDPIELSGEYLLDQLKAHDTMSGHSNDFHPDAVVNIPFHAIEIVVDNSQADEPVVKTDDNCPDGNSNCDGFRFYVNDGSYEVSPGSLLAVVRDSGIDLMVLDEDDAPVVVEVTSHSEKYSVEVLNDPPLVLVSASSDAPTGAAEDLVISVPEYECTATFHIEIISGGDN